MNSENTKKLLEVGKTIFGLYESEKKKLESQLAGESKEPFLPMAFGFDCGDGWFEILKECFENIEKSLSEFPDGKNVRVHQVKEKYGTLRIYMSHYYDKIEEFIDEAEKKSEVTCELCGSSGKLEGEYWLTTRCSDCHTIIR
jgi:hypothetical protein